MSWFELAACKDVDQRLFFPDSQNASVNRALLREARNICERCPVAADCHEFAQTSNRGQREQWGMWAGVNYSPLRTTNAPDPQWTHPRTLICDECGTAWRWSPMKGARPPRTCSIECRRKLQGRGTTLAAKLRRVG